MRTHLSQAEKRRHRYEKQRAFLNAVEIYCDAVSSLSRNLALVTLASRGFLALREYLTSYTQSMDFTALNAETQALLFDLAGVRYCLDIEGSRVTVSRSGAEADYGAEVARTFAKFSQDAANEHRFTLPSDGDLNPVEAVIMDLVAKLYPSVFSWLEEYCSRRRDYLDRTIREFDREVQFYLACLEQIDRFKRAGLRFCYPTVTTQSKEIYGYEVFDLALANKDEELSRMSTIVDQLKPNSMLLFNESFASTNQREAAEIARQIVRALLETGIKVVYVTHLFDLAHQFYLAKMDTALFLRAERLEDGHRTFRLMEGEPLPTSYGEDLYRRIFSTSPQAAAAAPRV